MDFVLDNSSIYFVTNFIMISFNFVTTLILENFPLIILRRLFPIWNKIIDFTGNAYVKA